jgi:hypothetical protein
MIQDVIILVFAALASASCGGAADSSYVGNVDHG